MKFTYIFDARDYDFPEDIQISKEYYEIDEEANDHADQVIFVKLGNNKGIVMRVLLSHVLAHQKYRPVPYSNGYAVSIYPLANLNKYDYRKDIINIQIIAETSTINYLH